MALGCDGALLNSYVKWIKQKNPDLASEENYPYKAETDTCQNYTPFYQGNRYESHGSAYLSN